MNTDIEIIFHLRSDDNVLEYFLKYQGEPEEYGESPYNKTIQDDIKYIEEIDQEKKRIMSLVSDMDLTVYPSYTNFFLMKSKMHDLARKLAECDVLVSDVSNHYSLSSEYIRVTIGSKKENDYFIKSLRKIMGV